MGKPIPKTIPKEKPPENIGFAGTVTNKTDNINNPIEWLTGPKLDEFDVLISAWGVKDIKFEIYLSALGLPYAYQGLNGYKIYEQSFAGYQISRGYACNGIQLFTLKCQPYFFKLPYAKVTTVPAEIIRFNKLEAFKGLLASFLGLNAKLTTKVSRADLAYDMEVDGSTLIWYSERAKKTPTFTGKSGEITFYLGSKKGPFQVRVYDKKKALWDKRGITITQKHMLRIELVMRGKYLCQPFIEGLKNLQNPLLHIRPYSRLGVINWFKKSGYADHVTELLDYGLNEAIKDLSLKERKAIIAALNKFAIPDWWNPQQMWPEMVEEAVKNAVVKLFKGEKLKLT